MIPQVNVTSRVSSIRMDPGEGALIAELMRGSQEAWATVVQRYSQVIFRISRRILRSDVEAEDVRQIVLAEMYRDLRKFDPRKSFAAWIKVLSRSRALDQRKHLERRGFYDVLPLGKGLKERSSDERRTERHYLFNELLKQLVWKERTMLVLTHFEGLEAYEVAATMGCSVRTVRRTLQSATRNLKHFLT